MLGLFGPNTGLLFKKWGVTGVRLGQGNTGQPTFLKKFGTSHTKTIKNGIGMESRINYVLFYEKKIPKNIGEIFLKSLWTFYPDRSYPILRYSYLFISLTANLMRISTIAMMYWCSKSKFLFNPQWIKTFSIPRSSSANR